MSSCALPERIIHRGLATKMLITTSFCKTALGLLRYRGRKREGGPTIQIERAISSLGLSDAMTLADVMKILTDSNVKLSFSQLVNIMLLLNIDASVRVEVAGGGKNITVAEVILSEIRAGQEYQTTLASLQETLANRGFNRESYLLKYCCAKVLSQACDAFVASGLAADRDAVYRTASCHTGIPTDSLSKWIEIKETKLDLMQVAMAASALGVQLYIEAREPDKVEANAGV